jgi:hypothetical protein
VLSMPWFVKPLCRDGLMCMMLLSKKVLFCNRHERPCWVFFLFLILAYRELPVSIANKIVQDAHSCQGCVMRAVPCVY